MRATQNQEEWTAKRWLALLGMLVALQVLALAWLSPRKTPGAQPNGSGIVAPASTVPAQKTGLVIPPADGALASLSGFSGDAWLRFTNPSYVSPAFNEPARELSLSVDNLGASLMRQLERPGGKDLETLSKWEQAPPPVLPVAYEVPPKSWLEITGGLSRWASNSIPELRPQPSAEILGSSVVLAGVDDNGIVFSAALMAKSGSAAADAEALALARSARFFKDPFSGSPDAASTGENSLHWGRLIFHWMTVAPPDTNTPSIPATGVYNAP